MKNHQGFTLLELLMVVIIIGILAAIALPQYMKLREKARMTEALSMLGQIRASELRFFAETSAYTAAFTNLDFDPTGTDVVGLPFYAYSVTASAGPPPDFVAIATRLDTGMPGCADSYTVRVDRDGNICGSDCQSVLTTC